MSFAIEAEWVDAPGVLDLAEARTWARLEFRVGSTLLSELFDARTRAVRRGPFGTALPVAEWLADSWPRLVGERRVPPPRSPELREWRGFHGLRAARQGGALPDLWLRRVDGRLIELAAHADKAQPAPGISVRFLNGFEEKLPVQAVKAALADFVQGVLSRLDDMSDPRVERLRSRWRSANSPLARIAGRLGSDDEFLEGAEAAALETLVGDPRLPSLAALAEGASGGLLDRIEQARTMLAVLPTTAPVDRRWRALETRLREESHTQPWLTGWAAAGQFRAALELEADASPGRELGAWIEQSCGWPASAQAFLLERAPIPAGVDTVHFKPKGAFPAVLTTRHEPAALRFRLARSLYHFLLADGRDDERVVADSPLLPGRLSEANAFAAELLAPAALLEQRAPKDGLWTNAQQRDLARELGVSPLVIAHQIENRELGLLEGGPRG